MVQNDTFRGIVSGVIRGARTVRINPTGSDTFDSFRNRSRYGCISV